MNIYQQALSLLVFLLGYIYFGLMGTGFSQEKFIGNDLEKTESFMEALVNTLAFEKAAMATLNRSQLQKMSGLHDKQTRVVKRKVRERTSFDKNNSVNRNSLLSDINLIFIENKELSNSIYSDSTIYFSDVALDQYRLPNVDKQLMCLAEAVYFEARGENLVGQLAVAEVVLNRVDSKLFPNSICEVISEGATRLNSCQFSYNCDGKPETIIEKIVYNRILKLSSFLHMGAARLLTGGAVFYHSEAVTPSWSKKFKKTNKIGGHLFYKIEQRMAKK
jgi:spore germination cell wall hydrolase CwlJ-like protein